MATSILSVITEYCSIYVDDLNMSELAATDPPLFARNAWQLLKPALAKFTHPPEMQSYLSYEEPTYESITYTTRYECNAVSGNFEVIYDGSFTFDGTETLPKFVYVDPKFTETDFDLWSGYVDNTKGVHTVYMSVPAINAYLHDDENDYYYANTYIGRGTGTVGFIAYETYEAGIVQPGTYKVRVFTTDTFRMKLGEKYKGYDLCGVRMRYYDRTGNLVLVPMPCYYDAATGDVFVAPTQDVAEGAEFEIDFYKDGQFNNTLTPQMCDIIGLCFQYVWQDRFNTDWLSIVSKIEDKSFQEQNRANKMNADGMRLREMAVKLYDSMRKFEQDVAYKSRFPGGTGIQIK